MTPILLSFSDSIANNYTPSASDLSTSLLFETKRSTKKQGKMFRINAACMDIITDIDMYQDLIMHHM